jgi:hypothetical protein
MDGHRCGVDAHRPAQVPGLAEFLHDRLQRSRDGLVLAMAVGNKGRRKLPSLGSRHAAPADALSGFFPRKWPKAGKARPMTKV